MTNEALVNEIRLGHDVAHNIEALYLQNIGLIKKIANKFNGYADFDDLIQEGYFGLLSAIESWDPQGGASFVAYAFNWIFNAMNRYVKSKGSLVRLPEYQVNDVYRYKKAVSAFNSKYFRDPSRSELSDILNLTEKQLKRIERDILLLNPSSLDKEVFENNHSIEDLIEDEHNLIDELLETVYQEELSDTLWPIVDTLNTRESDIIRKRYKDGLTLQSCGDYLGITRERVRQIEKKALDKLRSPKNIKALSPYVESKSESMAYSSVGLGSFSRTWTSAPERVVLYHEAVEERGQQKAI